MKRTLSIYVALLVVLLAVAMDSKLEDINAIKKSSEFLYAEATMPTPTGADSTARQMLHEEIIRWTTEQLQEPMDSLSAIRLCEEADTMMTSRANMFRVFTFIRKNKVSPMFKLQADEPSLLNDSTKKNLMRRFGNQKKIDNGTLQKVMKARNFFELKEIMEPLKEKGEILDYGKYATAKNPDVCYLIIYDPAGNIKAWLDKGKDPRRNLKTQKPDSISNYRGCGAIWFTIKN
jgi:hypothetical protein